MKPRPFDYVRPDTVEEALAVLAEHGEDARVLAGGQTLIAMLNLRVVEPAVLVDITRIPALGEIRELPHPDPPPQAGEGKERSKPQGAEPHGRTTVMPALVAGIHVSWYAAASVDADEPRMTIAPERAPAARWRSARR